MKSKVYFTLFSVLLMLGFLAPSAHAAILPSVCKTGKIICIDKSTRTLRLLNNGSTQILMSARFGAASTPTRNGLFKVYWKDKDHVSSVYGSAMPYSLFFSGCQAIHYSSDFAKYGYTHTSHGCVNVRSLVGARDLYYSVSVGTRVYIYWS